MIINGLEKIKEDDIFFFFPLRFSVILVASVMNRNEITLSVCRELARARKGKGMSQSALAAAVGCKQSQISMLESGQTEKIAEETVGKIGELLGVSLVPASETGTVSAPVPPPLLERKGYCPDCQCPGNVPYEVGGRLLFWPALQSGKRCAYCGEVLETVCPSCGAPVREGACCTSCGEPLVTPALPDGIHPGEWAEERRRMLKELRGLISGRGPNERGGDA